MYLKKIELFGFKSFADRTEVLFEPGVTCIVGPNGCGKSNISDAIRWVLGERRPKLLRGSKMEDVIFSGTDFRKPLNVSEVSLTIDNTDQALPIQYEEVVITRRLHRSGESEYLINKTPCRLKDVYDLILDTGIGSNSYSMIEQGRIDHILNAHAEERRSLIEEAAGISKYKVKKEEALRKLERTEQNLLRLNDIVSEVGRNIRYAERQAKRAERYKTKLDRLKDLETRRAFFELNKHDDELTELTSKKEKHETSLESYQAAARSLQDNLQSQDGALQELDQMFLSEESSRSEAKQKITSLEDHAKFNQEKVETLKLSSEKARGEIETLRQNLDRLRAESTEKETQTGQIRDARAELEADKARREAEFSKEEPLSMPSRQDVEEKQSIVFGLAHELSEIKNSLHEAELALATLSHTDRSLGSRFEKMLAQQDALNSKQSSIATEQTSSKSDHATLTNEVTALAQTRPELEGKIRDLEKHVKFFAAEKSKLENQVAILEELNLADGPDPKQLAKHFSENGSALKAIQALLDVIEIKPGYELAIEAVLSSSLRAVVAEDLSAAVRLVEHIQNNGSKHATIFIRDRAILNGGLNPDPEMEQHPAVKHHLWDAVQVKPGYEGIVGNLLSNTYVINEITAENADQFAKMSQRKKLVTKSGAVFGPEFQITMRNDRYTPEQSRIARRQALERSSLDIETSDSKLLEMNNELGSCQQQLASLSQREKQLLDQSQQQRISLERTQSTSSHLEEQIILTRDEIALIQQELAANAKEVARIDTRRNSLTASARDLAVNQDRAQAVLDEVKGRFEGGQSRRKEFEREISHIDIRLEALLDKETDVRHTVTLITEQIDANEARIHTLDQEISRSMEQAQVISHELAGHADEKRHADEVLLQRSVAVEQIRTKRNVLIDQKNQILSQVQGLTQNMEGDRQALHQNNLDEMKISHEKDSITKELQNRYKIDLQALDPSNFKLEEGGIDATQAEISELRQTIESTGSVNLMAIDEYDELKQRFDFLDNQKNDLEKARESLLEAIRQINRTTKKLFDDTLLRVREAFREYFRTLFGGGVADLVLLDELHPLDSGLDIVARPPGKKLQHITLLSGGEKALTAIALLLALFSVRPSPFCVLDEVDAPLDEANNERFLKVLKPFLGHTQFVIVTHSRKTISMANALYGVTMQEPGVSTMVSVRLSHSSDEIEHKDSEVTKELNQILN